MEFEVDKKALSYTFELLVLSGIILVSAHFIVREAVILSLAPEQRQAVPEERVILLPDIPADENEFYIQPRGEKPAFLGQKELEKKYQALVWEKRDFVFVDFDRATLSWYEKGVIRTVFPIVGMPKSGGFFDMPRAFYTVQGKAEQHILKSGRRHLSWAVYLFGNYLIHAGTPLRGIAALARTPQDEVGIQLASADAKYLFNKVTEGMPILVSRKNSPADISFSYFRKTLLPQSVPEVTAASALAADLETGEILFEKNKNDAYPTASLTKLMTALVAKDYVKPQRLLTVTDDALKTYGNSAELSKGETFRAEDLFHGLILASSNDIAVMFQIAVPKFIEKMNEQAHTLGLTKTFFEDSSGLSHNNVMSAADLFSLLRHINDVHPELLALSKEKKYSLTAMNKKRSHGWININWPQGDKRYLGGKAGFTDDSLQTMAGVWHARMSEYGGRKIVITLLGSRNRIRDVRAIIAYLERDFVYGFANGADKKGRPASLSSGASMYEAFEKSR